SINAQDLKTTIDEVLSTNPIILERLNNYISTKQDITTAKSGYYPKLDLSVGAGRENTKKEDANAITTLRDENDKPVDSLNLGIYQNTLTYTQNIFKGFQTTNNVDAQEQRTISAAYSYIEKVNDTSFEMVNTYLQVMKNQELLGTAKANVKINTEIFSKVNKLYDAGLTTLSEVNKIESSLALAKSNLVVQENTLKDTVYNLQRVLGRTLDPETMVKPTLDVELPKSLEEANKLSLQNNPSLLVSKHNINFAKASIRESRAPFYPSVDIEVSQSMNKNLSGVQGEDEGFKAMAYVKYNFFNGFADDAALQKSRSRLYQEQESKHILDREVTEGLSLSWESNKKLTEQLVHLKDYKKFSKKTLTLYSKEYDLGRRSLLDLLSAQNDFIGSKAQIINTEYSMLFAKYRILDAMGSLVSSIVGDNSIVYSNVDLVK
ncbi:MAG: TolC family outer membrane protein, partial [Sulfurimonas sp.]|nr:TolC family outer membrane protein [Sulfurimonas sp.]